MPFLDLPIEIREQIYQHLLTPTANRKPLPGDYTTYDYTPSLVLYHLNRQIYHESRKIFRQLNTFILIETPWIEAQHHVAVDGHVPILATGEIAEDFAQHTLTVSISAPHYPYNSDDIRHFVILLDDLDAFCNMWRYSDLTHPGLNSHLRMELRFQDPKIRGEWEEPTISKTLQSQLLSPFGIIKNLDSIHVTGSPDAYPSLVKDLKAAMLVPPESAESCLRRATALKDEGNVALQAGRCDEALELYGKAWLAMHIVVNGRERQIHGDAYFNKELTEEPFIGQQGHSVRLVLRVRLVANTVLAYLKLDKPEEAKFWGLRTINMIRQAIGLPEGGEAARAEDEVMLNFVAANEMGKIYYRTAVAYKTLDDKSEARKLLRIAQIYLPRDPNVAKEVAACALRLG